MDHRLEKLLLDFSVSLHDLEVAGVEIPGWIDKFWIKITAHFCEILLRKK